MTKIYKINKNLLKKENIKGNQNINKYNGRTQFHILIVIMISASLEYLSIIICNICDISKHESRLCFFVIVVAE